MNEREWLECTDPYTLFTYTQNVLRVGGGISPGLSNGTNWNRKLRLFACAVARLLENSYDPKGERTMVIEACETIADGFISKLGSGNTGLVAARKSIGSVWGWTWAATAENIPYGLKETFIQVRGNAGSFYRQELVAALFRDIVRNPFNIHQPQSCAHMKYTRDVITLQVLKVAQAIYHDGLWNDTPILADALEDEGCTNEEILGHLRSDKPHAKGCFVLDLVLNNE